MKSITSQKGKKKQFNVCSSSKQFAGYGHYKLCVELEHNGENKSFFSTTTDMEFIDDLCDNLDKDDLIYNHIEHKIKEEVLEWLF